MPTWSRRRWESIVLAMIAIASVLPLRYFVEAPTWFFLEMACLVLSGTLTECLLVGTFLPKRWEKMSLLSALVLATCPAAFAFLSRAIGSPIAFEISLLTTFGTTALAVALVCKSQRLRSLSLVVSGFLVLFTASISDSPYAAGFPILWMLGCVWHLIANHWERLDLAMPDAVERSWSLRPTVLVLTFVVLAGGTYLVKGRFNASNRLSLGIMPTSGGNKWSDPAARSGVGSGEAAIAAKNHAESFGAVDSELFLESTESSLFDMASDSLGDPIKPKSWESRQAIGDENVIQMHSKAAKSQKGSSAFSTDRMPPKKHQHFSDATDASVVQWDGPTGIRLAMHRYDQFDGREWTQSAEPKNQTVVRRDIYEEPWFFDRTMTKRLDQAADQITVGLLKVIRLNSQRIPAPMLTAGVHIKDVERGDFFGVAEDGSLLMPGREKIPDTTVIHIASIQLTEDEILANLQPAPIQISDDYQNARLSTYVKDWVNPSSSPLDQLQSVITRLRTDFTFQRAGEAAASSLEDFLNNKQGGDHLFATTVAMMARELGFPSRLVTGFYVRPDSFDLAAGHARVLPQDVHVWAEIRLGDGRWFEVEATPSYVQPHYQPSLWLRAKKFLRANWLRLVIGLAVVLVVWRTYRVWVDWVLHGIWSASKPLKPRMKLRLAMAIIECRANIAGFSRPPGQSQRKWLEELVQADRPLLAAVQQFTNLADALVFGDAAPLTTPNTPDVVYLLNVRKITALMKDSST